MCKLTTAVVGVFNLGIFDAMTRFEAKTIFWRKWMVSHITEIIHNGTTSYEQKTATITKYHPVIVFDRTNWY